MSQRQLIAVAAAFTLAVMGVAGWYIAGELEAARERLQPRPAPLPTSMVQPPAAVLPLTRLERA
jgi:hypothetical protein